MTSLGTTVPLVAPWIGAEGIATGRPVRGGDGQWRAFGAIANYLNGRGGALIPHSHVYTALDQNGTITLRFYVWPRYACRRRLWISTYGVTTAFAPCTIRFTDPSGGTSEATISAGASGSRLEHQHIEDVSSPSSSETELAPTWTETTDVGAPTLLSVACYELPRPELAQDSNEYGVDLSKLGQGRSIYTTTGVGPGAVVTAVNGAWNTTSRTLFQFARGQVDYLSLATTAAYAPVFTTGIPLLGRKETPSSTTRTAKVWCRVSSGAGTTGDVRFTMTSGASVTVSITAAMASTWVDNDLDIDCDDLSTSDGRRSSRDDLCTIEWRRTGGANSIYLESISIGNG